MEKDKNNESQIYGVSIEEFEFYESLHKFEQAAFWKGFSISSFIMAGIFILTAIIMWQY